MALFLEFVLAILLSLLCSFLLAKLFSVSSSCSSSGLDDDDHFSVLSPRKLVIKKLVSCERLFEAAESKKNGSGGERRIGFVPEVVEVDDFGESRQEKIEKRESLSDSCGLRSGFKIEENEVVGEVTSEGSSGRFGGESELEAELVVGSSDSERVDKIEEDLTRDELGVAKSEEIVVSESDCGNEILEANKNGEDGGVCHCEEILVDESTESGRVKVVERELCKNEMGMVKSEDEKLFDEDDDWEGIERTELERLFGSAVAFVGSKSNVDRISSLGSLVKMQLYGLHKIATEGPCHEPQPMALKVSARANWNAWKSLGNMTREDAMEQYVTILSRSIPGCIQDDTGGDSKQVSADSEACCKLASDLKAWQMNIVGPVDKRNVDELMPNTQGKI